MRLLDLDPRWLEEGGRKVGFVFQCPTKPKEFWQTCFLEKGRRLFTCDACRASRDWCCPHSRASRDWCCPHSQMGLVMRAGIVSGAAGCSDVQGCNFDCAWTVHGALDFATLTITPSLDGSAGGLWHGHITNGEMVGGL